MMLRVSALLLVMLLGEAHATADSVVTNIDPKHELLTEIAGR